MLFRDLCKYSNVIVMEKAEKEEAMSAKEEKMKAKAKKEV